MLPSLSSKGLRLTSTLLLTLMIAPAWAQEKIVLDGSSGMLPLARALATAYQQQSSSPQIETGKGLEGDGANMFAGARLRALAEGKIQIALLTQDTNPEDMQKQNMKVIEVARGAIVFAVNASVPISNINETQVCDIYSGRTLSWQALGGPDSPIATYTRRPVDVESSVIRDKVACFKELQQVETVRVMARGGDMAKGLAETPHAIGFTSMTVVEQSAGKVKALSLNGVAATAENVKSGRHVLSRNFVFVIKGEPTPEVKKFLDFVLSPAGDRVIVANGAIPLR